MFLGEPILWKGEIWYVSKVNKKTVCLINPKTRRVVRARIVQVKDKRFLNVADNMAAVKTVLKQCITSKL